MEAGPLLSPEDEALMAGKSCVKCPEPAKFCGVDVKKAVYCRPCFIQMVKTKFRSTLSKRRIYKDGESRETLVVFDGTTSAAFLLHQVEDALKQINFKRLMITPTIVVLVSCTDQTQLSALDEKITRLKELLPPIVPWIVVHLAAVLCKELPQNEGIGLIGKDMIPELTSLLNSCKTSTAREELKRILKETVYRKVAASLGIKKIMLPDDGDILGQEVLAQLCLGRGYVVSDMTSVVDKRPSGITLIRPLRDISSKEITIVSHLEGYEASAVRLMPTEVISSNSVQSLTSDFVESLMSEGFKATVTTVLSTASKLNSPAAAQKCTICVLSPVETSGEICTACDDWLAETGERQKILDYLL